MLGLRRKGVLLISCFVFVLICFWPLRLLRFYAGLVGLYLGWIAIFVYAPCSAQLAHDPKTGSRPSRWWLTATIPIALLSLSLLGRGITRASGFRTFSIPSTSMERTIQRGDHVVADTWYYHSRSPAPLDVLVFRRADTFFAKRVIALGGDTIEGKDAQVFVNGQLLSEGYVEHQSFPSLPDTNWMNTFGPIKVPPGKFFVMGDNRDVSLDSRSPEFGLVDQALIVGKVLYVFGTDREGSRIQ